MIKKFPKPWFRESRNIWVVTLDGKQHNLGPDENVAFEEYKGAARFAETQGRRPRPILGRPHSVYDVLEDRPLSPEAVAERVTGDKIIALGADTATTKPDHRVCLITIAAKPHQKRAVAPGPGCDGTLRIATNLLDVPAEVIALLYYRWTIEIFFRFFKQILGCRHLLSGSQNGIEIQTYCAIIACMLISLWTGKKAKAPPIRRRGSTHHSWRHAMFIFPKRRMARRFWDEVRDV